MLCSPRLSNQIFPKNYDIQLEFSSHSNTFHGKVEIRVEIKSEVEKIQLHASDLQICSVEVDGFREKFKLSNEKELLEILLKHRVGIKKTRKNFQSGYKSKIYLAH